MATRAALSPQQQAAEDRDHDILRVALAGARRAGGSGGSGGAGKHSATTTTTMTKPAAATKETGGSGTATATPDGEVVLQEMGLSQRQVADLLQLWDFLRCFREPLAEAGFSPGRPPSLTRLAQALASVDDTPAAPASSSGRSLGALR